MVKQKQIVVVGGGIGGMAVATALAQQGAQVSVLEQAEAIREVGAGLQISPNGLCVLRALGIEEQLARLSSRGQAVSLRRAESNREVARLDLTRLPQDMGYHFVHRADLIELLSGSARAAGVTIRLLQKVVHIEPGAPARVDLDTGASLHADLVIDASGLHSALRASLNGHREPFFTGQVAWRAVIPNRTGRLSDVQVHMAPKRHLVSYPLRGGKALNLVAVQERSLWAAEGWAHRDSPGNLQAAFDGAAPEVMSLLEQVDEVHLWGLFRHPVAQVWQAQGCALLGDAAHPTLPFLAQGANMALEDAWALAAELVRRGITQDALQHYQALRQPRASKVIKAASGNAQRYHLPYGLLRVVAHSALALGSRLAPNVMLGQFDWLYRYDITKQAPM